MMRNPGFFFEFKIGVDVIKSYPIQLGQPGINWSEK